MRWFVLIERVIVIVAAVSALRSRARCAFVTDTCLAANLFSYFTIESALALVLVLVIAMGYAALSSREPEWLTALRALAVTYVVVSGVTFGLLLSNANLLNHTFLVPLSSKMLHFVLPVIAVLDFLLVPTRRRLPWNAAWLALVFPLLWAAYTLIRGSTAGWYPYFFLDPEQVGGYRAVSIYAAALTLLILAVSFSIIGASRLPRPTLANEKA
jgi:hypothetical protein